MRFAFALFTLVLATLPAWADTDDDKLKAIIGIDFKQLTSCNANTDCVAGSDPRKACTWFPMNQRYRVLAETNLAALLDSFDPGADHSISCAPAVAPETICDQGLCKLH